MSSYRNSHLDKSADYDEIFRRRLRESMLWDLEKSILDSLVGTRWADRPPRHLDFACGTGRVLGHLSDRVRESVGLDVSANMLSTARVRSPASQLVQGDITRTPLLEGREFDLITAFRFFPNAEPALRRDSIRSLSALLSSQGAIVFNNHLNDTSSVRRLQRLARRRVGHTMSQGEVEQVLAWGDLRLDAQYGLGLLPDFGEHRTWSRLLVKRDRRIHTRPHLVGLCEYRLYVAVPDR